MRAVLSARSRGGAPLPLQSFWVSIFICPISMPLTNFAELLQAEQARAVQPAHVYPLLGVGCDSETGELLFSVQLYSAVKDVCRVSHLSALACSCAAWQPLWCDMLPAVSVATFRSMVPHLHIVTHAGWQTRVRSQAQTWSGDGAVLFHGGVTDCIPNIEFGQYVGSLPTEDFLSLISGHTPPKMHRVPKMWVLLLWNALYVHWSRAVGLARCVS